MDNGSFDELARRVASEEALEAAIDLLDEDGVCENGYACGKCDNCRTYNYIKATLDE